MRLKVTPIDPAVTGALVASGDLDREVAARVPVYDITSTKLEWTQDRGFSCLP
jgi:hypothetical protein